MVERINLPAQDTLGRLSGISPAVRTCHPFHHCHAPLFAGHGFMHHEVAPIFREAGMQGHPEEALVISNMDFVENVHEGRNHLFTIHLLQQGNRPLALLRDQVGTIDGRVSTKPHRLVELVLHPEDRLKAHGFLDDRNLQRGASLVRHLRLRLFPALQIGDEVPELRGGQLGMETGRHEGDRSRFLLRNLRARDPVLHLPHVHQHNALVRTAPEDSLEALSLFRFHDGGGVARHDRRRGIKNGCNQVLARKLVPGCIQVGSDASRAPLHGMALGADRALILKDGLAPLHVSSRHGSLAVFLIRWRSSQGGHDTDP